MELFDVCEAAVQHVMSPCKSEAAQGVHSPVELSLEDRLVALYDKIFTVAQAQTALRQELMDEFSASVGFCDGAPADHLKSTDVDEIKLARRILDEMTTEAGRAVLGLNRSVQIDHYNFHETFLQPLQEANESRRGRYRMSEDDNKPLPRLDVHAAIAYLRSTYGGVSGEHQRLVQVASALSHDLDLRRQKFCASNGKVVLEVRVYVSSWQLDRGEYDRDNQHKLAKLADGFMEVFRHFNEDVPYQLIEFRNCFNSIGPAQTYEMAPALKLRTFKGHYRLTMTEGFAEKLREFITEFRSSQNE
jgi:hypothetical protein